MLYGASFTTYCYGNNCNEQHSARFCSLYMIIVHNNNNTENWPLLRLKVGLTIRKGNLIFAQEFTTLAYRNTNTVPKMYSWPLFMAIASRSSLCETIMMENDEKPCPQT